MRNQKGFTLVELLIVISLIAILSVAVLSTINPIEQANKARDSRTQNDAAEVMNAYERYFATSQAYPWETFTGGTPITNASAVGLRSDTYGFGICSGQGTDAALRASAAVARATSCASNDTVPNLLISTDELKSSFAGKDMFEPVRDDSAVSQGLWTLKAANDNSIFVCYIPRAAANRSVAANMRCIDTATGTVGRIGNPAGCLAAVADWDVPVVNGTSAMFRCVPE
jgi:prepilin-type N-terminal cleavage/methylation domain-containing protein